MKTLFWVGLVVLALGVASLVVPIRRTEKESVKAGPISMEVQTKHDEMVSPIVSAAMILTGAGLMIAGRPKS